ncbi:hypothetical protein L6R29_05515 [Myxococcota bacterium]|nr:hypothetical protein [Myxococcota bacterium]
MWRMVAWCVFCGVVWWGCTQSPTLPEGSALWPCQENKECEKLGVGAHCEQGLCVFWKRGDASTTEPYGAEEQIAVEPQEAVVESPEKPDTGVESELTEQEAQEAEPENPCAEGKWFCAGACVDTQTDPKHCGQCNNACEAVEVCQRGICSCPNGGRLCGGVCVDIQASAQHCGVCDAACLSGQICAGGLCQTPCKTGEIRCGMSCVDPKQDPRHCGKCGQACRNDQGCLNGFCGCAGSKKDCGGICVDIRTDPSHCGDCGQSCGADAAPLCQGGACVSACVKPATACANVCADVMIDPKNCGACGSVCSVGATCQNGACSCASGRQECKGECVDVKTDAKHCGKCEDACASNASCVGGSCVCSNAALAHCKGECVDLKESNSHCGTCGKSCLAGELCVGGGCRKTPYVTTMAGPIAPAVTSPFSYPCALGYVSHTGLLVGDRNKDQVLLVSGPNLSGTWAGSVVGDQNSANPLTAKLSDPCGIAEGPNRVVFISDTSNHKIRFVDPTKGVGLFAGSTLGDKEGTREKAQFHFPRGIVYDANAKVFYVADMANNRIRQITLLGEVSTFAGNGKVGTSDGTSLTTAQFHYPLGLALDGQGNLYVSDYLSHRIRKIDLNAKKVFTVAAGGFGLTDGTAGSAKFRFPMGLAWDGRSLYIADRDNHRIRKFDPATNQVSTLIGKTPGYKDGGVLDAQFYQPTDILWLSGSLYVADGLNRALRRIWMR